MGQRRIALFSFLINKDGMALAECATAGPDQTDAPDHLQEPASQMPDVRQLPSQYPSPSSMRLARVSTMRKSFELSVICDQAGCHRRTNRTQCIKIDAGFTAARAPCAVRMPDQLPSSQSALFGR
jgi:hypothetical protein